MLDRDAEVLELAALVADGKAGRGRMTLVEGPAGIGKTRLLSATRAMAAAAGSRVLHARGGELEGDFGFGVVRQLLEPHLARADATRRNELYGGAARLARPVFAAEPSPLRGAPAHSVLHGLYWLVANLAEESPLLISVDDVHWVDAASVRFLLHLAARLEGLPVAICLSARTGETGVDPALLSALLLEAASTTLRPRPLSRAAVARLGEDGLGARLGSEACEALHEVSGGNPFLVVAAVEELLSELESTAVITPAVVRRLGSKRIAASLLLRVGRVGRAAPAFCRAVAVLGEEATSGLAARLAGVVEPRVPALVDALRRAAVLTPGEPLEFVHPLVRTAIHEEMSGPHRAELHARAARLLCDEGSTPELVGRHLLGAAPRSDPWVVGRLREAATTATARGSPETAVTYLRRALREPPDQDDLGQVVFDTGRAEVTVGDPAGIQRLYEAVAQAAPGRRRAEVSRVLARALVAGGRQAEGVAVYDRAIEDLGAGDHDLALALDAEAANAARMLRLDRLRVGERMPPSGREPAGATVAEEMVLAQLAHDRAVDNGAASHAAALAERALRSGRLVAETPDAGPVWDAVLALIFADELDLADHHLECLLADGRRNGSLVPLGGASAMRALSALRRGDMTRTASEAQAALHYTQGALGLSTVLASAYAAHALIERGDLDSAATMLQLLPATDPPDDICFDHMLFERARLRIAKRQFDGATADLRLLSEHAANWHRRRRRAGEADDGLLPCLPGIQHRAVLAAALRHLDLLDEAREAVAEEERLARAWNTPRALGNVLRARALLEEGDRRVASLAEAVEALASSPGRLDHSYALVEYGSALRRAGKQAAARAALEEGMDLAHHCGALALGRATREELRLLGARPRRLAVTGVDSLTPSEYRVCDLAAQGMTNKEIAQALFVTLRTVEGHLTNSFAKLEIPSREHLPKALG
jgi:DNA-binding CsgD family transcriptional regulator